MQELWNGFCYRIGTLKTQNGAQNRVGFGDAHYLELAEGEEYTVCITPTGAGLRWSEPQESADFSR